MKIILADNQTNTTEKQRTANSTLPKVAVQCFVRQFYGYINFSASLKVCVVNRHLRQAAKRYASLACGRNYFRYEQLCVIIKNLEEQIVWK